MKVVKGSTLTIKLAKRIASVGNRQGHTISTLASHSKVSKTTVSRILRSAVVPYNPSIRTVEKLAKGLGMKVGALLDVSNIRV